MNLKDSIYRKLDIQIRPTLLHGDLWSGNYIRPLVGLTLLILHPTMVTQRLILLLPICLVGSQKSFIKATKRDLLSKKIMRKENQSI